MKPTPAHIACINCVRTVLRVRVSALSLLIAIIIAVQTARMNHVRAVCHSAANTLSAPIAAKTPPIYNFSRCCPLG